MFHNKDKTVHNFQNDVHIHAQKFQMNNVHVSWKGLHAQNLIHYIFQHQDKNVHNSQNDVIICAHVFRWRMCIFFKNF